MWRMYSDEVRVDVRGGRMLPPPRVGRGYGTIAAPRGVGGWPDIASFQGNRLLHENALSRPEGAAPTQSGIRVWAAGGFGIHVLREICLLRAGEAPPPRPNGSQTLAFIDGVRSFKATMAPDVAAHRKLVEHLGARLGESGVDWELDCDKGTLTIRPLWNGVRLVARISGAGQDRDIPYRECPPIVAEAVVSARCCA